MSLGKIYEILGFKQILTSKPDYFYTKAGKPYSKQSKKKTKEEITTSEKTEIELRMDQGFARVWDCGKITWLFNI